MSPLACWQQFFNIETTYLPVDPYELDEICCDVEMRVISHIGIELMNCVFNSHALQEIRRQAPSVENVQVKIRFNRASMAHIWVTDAKTGSRLMVANIDPKKASLSAAQVAAAQKLRRSDRKTNDEFITFGEALRRMTEIGQALLRANTQTKRRQGFKLLGFDSLPDAKSPRSANSAPETVIRLSDALHPSEDATLRGGGAQASKPAKKRAGTGQPEPRGQAAAKPPSQSRSLDNELSKSASPSVLTEPHVAYTDSPTALQQAAQSSAEPAAGPAATAPIYTLALPIFGVTRRDVERPFFGDKNANLR